VFLVSTADHGGIMVRRNAAEFLSDYARRIAQKAGNYLCFTLGCEEYVVMRELLDKKLWQLPDRIGDKATFEETINHSLQQQRPEYWASRQTRLSLSERLKDGTDRAASHNTEQVRVAVARADNLELG